MDNSQTKKKRRRLPPRFALRQSTIEQILKKYPPGKFLELGFGNGETLGLLAARGFYGDAYDPSPGANAEAAHFLSAKGVTQVRLLQSLDTSATYDYIFFFEVIGYWKDPADGLRELLPRLNPGGKLIFSFTKKDSAGFAEKATGNMRCFSRAEVKEILQNRVGIEIKEIWNYGFPLTNIMKPFLNLFHYARVGLAKRRENEQTEIESSGLAEKFSVIRLVSAVLNPVTLRPFTACQALFSRTDLGNGYVVIAGK